MSEQPIRLVLNEDQSAFIRETGHAFLIVSPGSYPQTTGRVVLHLIPCERDLALAACEVATGQRRAVRISKPSTKA